MALPLNGQLSFSAIATEVGIGTPFSLRTMSSIAGFSTPDNISEFYGYGGLTYTYFTYATSDPCLFGGDIYLGSDGVYYFYDGTYTKINNISTFWYAEGFYEPAFDAWVWARFVTNKFSSTWDYNGSELSNCPAYY